MEERRYKTESGTIVYWVSYASHYEESPDTEASLESASEEELAFAPDAAASVMSSQLEKSINKALIPKAPWLVFLPGLTADHRLFNRQLSYFAETMNCFVWDAPAHGKSRPFALTFSMDDLATMLHDILCAEYIENHFDWTINGRLHLSGIFVTFSRIRERIYQYRLRSPNTQLLSQLGDHCAQAHKRNVSQHSMGITPTYGGQKLLDDPLRAKPYAKNDKPLHKERLL